MESLAYLALDYENMTDEELRLLAEYSNANGIQLKARKEQQRRVERKNREPNYCPRCGGERITHAVEWFAHSLDPNDLQNTGILSEYQCHDCCSSWWM